MMLKEKIKHFYPALPQTALLSALILLLIESAALAAPKITANALFEGKAVLVVDGKHLFLAAGQQKQGIKLIEADEYKAVIEVDGKSRTLYLDKTIAKKYASSADWKRNITAKSHVISAKMVHQTHNIATFEVDYYFDEKTADSATLSAKTMFKNEITKYWAHTYTRLNKGRNIAVITVSMNNEAPERYTSDAVRFDINLVKGGSSSAMGTKLLEFIKEWQQ